MSDFGLPCRRGKDFTFGPVVPVHRITRPRRTAWGTPRHPDPPPRSTRRLGPASRVPVCLKPQPQALRVNNWSDILSGTPYVHFWVKYESGKNSSGKIYGPSHVLSIVN